MTAIPRQLTPLEREGFKAAMRLWASYRRLQWEKPVSGNTSPPAGRAAPLASGVPQTPPSLRRGARLGSRRWIESRFLPLLLPAIWRVRELARLEKRRGRPSQDQILASVFQPAIAGRLSRWLREREALLRVSPRPAPKNHRASSEATWIDAANLRRARREGSAARVLGGQASRKIRRSAA
jgi:hypothetical protein